MGLNEKAKRFAELHVKGKPLLLYNAWDAGSAKAIVESGAKAIASSSWAVAAAHGYADGEVMPLPLHLQIAARIVELVDVPVTVDFEGGYSEDDGVLADNVGRLMDMGVVGINFEDGIVGGIGVHSILRQSQRIAVIRAEAARRGQSFFINARTDLFFLQGADQKEAVSAALERACAYADAGASGLFVPGLDEAALIARLCDRSPIPVNVMVMSDTPPISHFGSLGVSRISLGPRPYLTAMRAITEAARVALGS